MDWKKLVAELKLSGLTQAAIAERVGVTQPVISDLYTGETTNPNFKLGWALVELHKKQVSKTAKAA